MSVSATDTEDESEAESDDDRTPVPEPIKGSSYTASVLRNKIWMPANRENNWCAFVLVGREGSGKSYTCASILSAVDPSFGADRVFFDPAEMLEWINDTPKPERQGKAVQLDEAGVEMGVRSWYDQDQIAVNKALQTLRDDNMIIGLTLPAFGLLDSQTRTRLHGFCEMRELHPGEKAIWSWKNIVVNREEDQDEIKRKPFPRLTVNGRTMKVERCAIGPPPEEWVSPYEKRKAEFKQDYIDSVINDEEDDADDSPDPGEIATEIVEQDRIDEFLSFHSAHKRHYVDKDLIYHEFDGLTHSEAQTVKKLVATEWDDDNE